MGKRGLCFFRQVNLQKANIPDGFFLKLLGSQRYGQFQNRSFIYKFPFLRGFGALKIPSQSTQRGSSQVLSSHALSSPAAHFLKVSENALRIMVHRGQIQAYKFGRRLRFRLCDLQALFQKKGA